MTAYRKMTEKMTLLQIPVIVDRAKDEKGKDAQKEWEKVYQVTFLDVTAKVQNRDCVR